MAGTVLRLGFAGLGQAVQRILVHDRKVASITELLPELVEFVLAPYLGPEAAHGLSFQNQETG